MANQTEVLGVLSTKEEATSPSFVASELRAGEATIVTYLNRLKKKGFVDGGGKEWYISDAGRKFLESAKKVPVTTEDVGEDELSKFQWYGQLSGVDPDVITAAAELFQNTDMRNMTEVERVLAEMNVPGTQRTKWKNLYRGYLRNTTAPEKREELYPLPSPEEVRAGAEEVTTEGGEKLDYIVEENNVLRVGEGLGMFTFKQALQVVAAKRGTTPQVAQGQQGQPLDADGIIKIVNAVKDWTGQTGQKSYIVTQGEEGAVVQEVQSGQPVVVNAPTGSKPSLTYFVDGEGNIKQAQPGEPIIIKQVTPPASPGKTFIVKQTPEGIVTEEYEVGKPIIINAAPPSSSLPPMMPFPVIGGDGQPIYDQDGKPVYANLEPMLKWMGFQDDRRRADERQGAIMGLVKTVRENFGDGIAALKAAASEIKASPDSKPPAAPQQQVFQCGDCQTQFSPPAGWTGEPIKCPNPSCGREYTKEELLG